MPTVSDLANYASIGSVPLAIFLWLVTVDRFAAFWKRWRGIIFIVVAGLGLTAAWRIGWMHSTWQFATAAVTTPRWLFWLLVFVATVAIFAVGTELLKDRRPSGPSYLDYTEDSLFGATWRWQYQGGIMTDPWCYCPRDDMVLVYSEGRDWTVDGHGEDMTKFTCERCGEVIMSLRGDKEYAVARVRRHVDHAIRTGAWRSVVRQRGRTT